MITSHIASGYYIEIVWWRGNSLLIEAYNPLTKYHSNHSRQSGVSISYHTIMGEFTMDFLTSLF